MEKQSLDLFRANRSTRPHFADYYYGYQGKKLFCPSLYVYVCLPCYLTDSFCTYDPLNGLQVNFANFEQIKKFTLLPQPFSMENGELTNTLKMKRAAIEERYATEIEKMYE